MLRVIFCDLPLGNSNNFDHKLLVKSNSFTQLQNPRYKKLTQAEIEARLGLTPDWMIAAIAHRIFLLPEPTPVCPYIPGLLDPCTNDKEAPNIPAEVLYD